MIVDAATGVQFYEHEAPQFGAGKEPGEQGSLEWLMARTGHVTASCFKDVLDFTQKGKEGSKRRTYRMETITSRLTGSPPEHYVSRYMEEGTEREPYGRMAYTAATGRMVDQTGFIHHPGIKWVGGSPDGLIGEDGGLEVKCPAPGTHIDLLLTEDVSKYVAQCQGLMWITNRSWWDLCSYCPDMPDGLQLFIKRLPRDTAYIENLQVEVARFLGEVSDTIARLTDPAFVSALEAGGKP